MSQLEIGPLLVCVFNLNGLSKGCLFLLFRRAEDFSFQLHSKPVVIFICFRFAHDKSFEAAGFNRDHLLLKVVCSQCDDVMAGERNNQFLLLLWTIINFGSRKLHGHKVGKQVDMDKLIMTLMLCVEAHDVTKKNSRCANIRKVNSDRFRSLTIVRDCKTKEPEALMTDPTVTSEICECLIAEKTSSFSLYWIIREWQDIWHADLSAVISLSIFYPCMYI